MQPFRTDPAAVTISTPSPRVPRQPGNQGEGVSASTSGRRPMRPQPVRRWLAVIFTAFALLTAGGAHAQTFTSATLDAEAGDLTLVFSGDISALMDGRIHIREVNTTTGGVVLDSAQRGTLAGNTVDYDLTPANMVQVQAMTEPQLHFDLNAMTLAAGGGEPAGTFPRLFDVRDAVYSNVDFNPSFSPYSITFNSNGMQMFLVNLDGDTVNRFTLGTAYDLSTATTSGMQSYSVRSDATGIIVVSPNSVAFNSGGTKMFVTNQSNPSAIREYSLSPGYDLTNVTFDQNVNIQSTIAGIQGIDFNTDGSILFAVGTGVSADATDPIREISLTTNYDLNARGTVNTSFGFGSNSFNPRDIAFNATGTRMFIISSKLDTMYQYDLVSTYTTVGADTNDEGSIRLSTTQDNLHGLAFNATGDRMFTVGSSPGRVHQFNLNPPRAIDVVDNTDPSILSARTDAAGASIVLTFDEPLMTNSPLASEFRLEGTSAVVDGVTHINSGTHSALMTLLVTPNILITDTAITLTRTANATITDEAGNLLPTLTNHPVTNTIPTVPFVVSVSGTDGFYNLDDPLALTVLFSEPINLNVGTATLHVFTQPSCGLNGCGFTATNTALTTQLSFGYDVLQNDDTRDLAYTGINALVLQGGGTIRNAANNIDADLTLPEPGQEGSLSANSAIVLDTFKPTFPDPSTPTSPHGVTVGTNTAATSTVYNAQATDNSRGADTGITYALSGTHAATFELDTDLGVLTPMATLTGVATYSVTLTATDEADNVSDTFYLEITVSELPTVNISNNIATGTVANRADGDITFMLWFSEDVTGFESTDVMISGGTRGVVTLPDGSQPNPATTYGSANTFTFLATPTTNTDDGVLTVTVAANAATAGAGRGTVAIEHIQMYDTLAPELSLADIYYILNDSPTEAFDADATDGTGDADADITYSLGTSADDNLFDIDTDSGVATYMATPTDGDTHAPTVTATDEAGNTAMSAVNISVVNRATVESVSGVDGFYKAGDEVLITVTFSEAVVVANSPLLSLNTGAADGAPNAAFHSGDGSSTAALTFLYTVEADDNTSDLAYASGPNQITLLPSTTIRNADAAINANLALPDPGTAGSLSANSAIVLDTAAPAFPADATTGVVAINSATSVVAYDAQATDNGGDSETADAGVTYDFGGGTDDGLFNIMDAAIGEVRYNDRQPNIADHAIIITATDVAGNATAHNVSIGVRAAPEVRITDSVTSTYTNAAVTFTIRFTEAVTGFEASDVTVTDSAGGTMTPTITPDPVMATTYAPTQTFTLVATPTANTNDGTLTVTVAANAVMGTQTSAGNTLATAEQRYDTMNPTLPQEEGLFITNDPPAPALDLNGYDVNGNTDSVTYSFGGGTHDHLFTLDADNGQVRYINTPSGSGNHFIDIIATDKGGNTATRRNLAISFTFRSTVTSVGGVDGFYKENDPVSIFVTFNRAVSVSGTGKPQLTLNTDTTSTSVGTATYSTGTNVLTFIYTVRDGDNTPNLAYTGTDALSAARFGITNSGSIDAILTLPGVGDTTSLSGSSTIVLDTITPVFPAPGDATSDSDPLMLVLATGAADTTEVHNAEATDNGGASETADDGITYALSGTGTDADAFSFDTVTGVLTPAASPTAEGTYTLTITATDQAGNAAIQHLRVNVAALPTVNITDTITGTANIADGDITFMLWFSEDVTGFDASDLTVTGHTGVTPVLSPPPNMATTYGMADTFTLVVTPLSGTDSGALTIAVEADAATTTDGTSRMTVGISHEQPYDTLAPVAPTFNPVGTPNDGYLNAAAAAQPSGQLIGGKSDTMVTLCLAGTGGDSCGSGRTTRGTNFISSIGGGRGTWSYLLTTDDIAAMNEGDETLTAIATDAAGNPTEASVDIIVDTIPPAAPAFSADAIATDGIINLAERTDGGVTVSGTTATDVTAVILCAGATDVTDSACDGGATYGASVGTLTSGSLPWSYTLTTADLAHAAFNDGLVTLTAIATDMAGNPAVSTNSDITVDATPPGFSSGPTGVVGIDAPITTVAYNAQATDNNDVLETADAGVTYSFGGGTDDGLFNIMDAAIGEVRYNDEQSAITDPDHTIIITATDVAGNATTHAVTISVREAPEVIITGGTSGYVNSAVTFFFSFSEDVIGFEPMGDVSVSNGSGGAISPPPEETDTYGTANTFSLVVTPTTSDNDGVLTVTVNAGAVMRATGTATNPVAVATQIYDNVAPLLALEDVNYIIDESPLQVFNADATDDGRTDTRITYSFGGGTDDEEFMIDPTSGTVSYRTAPTTPDTHDIRITATDKGGNPVTTAVSVNVVNLATVTSVVGTEGTFGEGVRMSILVTFSENVTVDRTGGDPVLELNTGNTSVSTTTFFSSSGNEVFFVYDVRAGDNTSNLVSTSINALTLPTGTTIQTSNGLNAILTLPTGSAALGGTTTTALDGIIPVFPDAAMEAATPLVRTIATNSTAGTLVYDANATNNGGASESADAGLSYGLGGTDAGRFSIDPVNGMLTTTMAEPGPATYTLTLTATDEATSNPTGMFPNVATQHLRVDVPSGPTITSETTGTANLASGALTFTLRFYESVTGFETGDLTFTGGRLNTITPTPVAGNTYTLSDSFTLVVTPLLPGTNDGTLTVTLLAGAAHAISDTSRLTPIATASRMYDTLAPDEPTFSAASITALEAINRAEENAGVPLNGTVESGVSMVLFCFNDGTGSVSTCTGGLPASTVPIGTTWSFTLTSTSIDTIGEGAATMRVVAADAAGNNSTAVSTPIFIDTVPPAAPTFADDIATDLIISAAERDNGVTVRGGNSADTTAVTLCLGADSLTDAACATGTSRTSADNNVEVSGMTWSYTLTIAEVNAMEQGDEFLTAIGIDSAGNPGVAGGTTLTVDTTAPEFTSDTSGVVVINSAISVVAYDADATDNGGDADDDVTYSLSGGTHANLFNIAAATGLVTYKAIQTDATMHTFVITATDTVGNPATQEVTISVLDVPGVIITDSVTSKYANAAVTFTISFTEAVTGFEETDVTVAGGMRGTMTPTPMMATTYATTQTFTLVATLTAGDNDGVLTITVAANAITRAGDTTSNVLTSATQKYDNVDPILAGGDGISIRYAFNDLPLVPFVYNANATDDGMTFAGISYSLSGGANDGLFTIDPDSGIVSYIAIPTATELTHNITVVATDKGGNTDTLKVRIAVISRATVVSVSAADGFYTDDDILSVTVEFSEVVTVTTDGTTAGLTLKADTTSPEAVYSSGSGTTSLLFTYTVKANDHALDLDYSDTTSLVLKTNDKIFSRGNFPVHLTLPEPGSRMSLSGTSDVVLDNTAPVFPDTGTATNPHVVTVAIGTTGTVYDANATDRGRTADTGISYTWGGTDMASFSLDTTTGVLTPVAPLADVMMTYSVTITATDEVGNGSVPSFYLEVRVANLPVVTITDNIAIGTPTTRLTDTANIADGALTFMLSFGEPVTGFERSDITVTGGILESLTPPPVETASYTSTDIFTLVARPDANTNAGMLTITLRAGAATASGSNTVVTAHTQAYDTQTPSAPTFDAIATDKVINAVDQAAGVDFTGAVESGASVALCFNDGAGSVAVCTGGVRTPTATTPAAAGATTWSHTLTPTNITTISEGVKLLRTIATDAAGNPSAVASTPFTVDTLAPEAPTIDDIAEDDTINLAEQTEGVTITGTVGESVAMVQLCYGGDGSETCSGTEAPAAEVTVSGTTWSRPLVTSDSDYTDANRLVDGARTLQVRAIDAAGNPSVYGASKTVTVDTTVPVFTSAATGTVATDSTITVTAYDANATNNGGNSETADAGITYILGGTNVNLFDIDADSGIVTYRTVQTTVTTAPHHRIVITATDTAGNTATQAVAIEVLNAPGVIINSSVTSEYINGDITYTFSFSEPVTGFEAGDVTVTGSSTYTLTPSPVMATTYATMDTFTLVATPTAGTNDGVLTVTVAANAVTGTGTVTTNGNPKIAVTQKYDTMAPVFPSATAGIRYILNDPPASLTYGPGATDGGGMAHDGITYSLSDDGAEGMTFHIDLFNIDPGTGIVSYITIPTVTEQTHNIIVVATDKVGNTDTLPVTIAVISRATVVSVSATDGFYKEGATLSISLTFSEAPTVTGTPQLALNTGNTSDGIASYTGDDTTTVTFTYTVREGDDTRNLAYTGTDALSLNEGTIQTRTNLATKLTLPAVGSENSLSADTSAIVLDTTEPEFPGAATSNSTPLVRTIAIGNTTATVVYNAAATDNGRTADTGITYAKSGTNAADFSLDTLSGVLTPTAALALQTATTGGTYTLTLTATDEATNAATQHLRVVVSELPVVTLTSATIGTANIASGVLTFTLEFSEDVTGFEPDDITVTGGSLGTITPTPVAATTYKSTDIFTLLATPLADTNSGVLTITVRTDAATAASGTDGRNTIEAAVTQAYDTLATIPTIDDLGSGDNLNVIDATTDTAVAVTVTGTNEAGASVTLFANATTDTAMTYTPVTVSGMTWSITLTVAQITALDAGFVTLTAIATDTAGNPPAVSLPLELNVVRSISASEEINIMLPNSEVGSVRLSNEAMPGDKNTLRVSELELPSEHAANTPPPDTKFSLTVDLELDNALTIGEATVCLPTTGVPAGREAMLYHYEESVWVDISTASNSISEGSVCGEVATFSPFAVVYTVTVLATALTINDLGSGDNLNVIDATANAPDVIVTGTNESGASVILCVNPTTDADTTCSDTGSTMYDAAPVTTTTWSVTLIVADLAAAGFVILTAIATDADGNLTVSPPLEINVIRSISASETIQIMLPDRKVGSVMLSSEAIPGDNNTLRVSKLPPEHAANTPPPGTEFSLTVDLALDDALTSGEATVCLPTTGVPTGRDAMLYHYEESGWVDISTASISESEGSVCGEVATFSPFAVGWANTRDANTRLNEQILSRVSQAATAGMLAAVAERVESAASGGTSAPAVQFGGQSSLRGLLTANGQAILEDNMEYDRLWHGASFALPLDASANDAAGRSTGLALWGSSDYRSFGDDNDGIEWDGELTSVYLGVDGKVSDSLLGGFALSLNSGSFDYTDSGGSGSNVDNGDYQYNATIVHPYIGWLPREGLRLWALAGIGSGEIEIGRTTSNNNTTDSAADISQQSLAGGFANRILGDRARPGGLTSLDMKGDIALVSVTVDENTDGDIAAQTIDTQRLRLLLSGGFQRDLSHAVLTPLLEVGLRYDGGAGATGAGIEVGGGVRYAQVGGNLSVSGNVRTLVAHQYDEWGMDLSVQLLPQSGRGLQLSVSPVWGNTQSAAEQLWNDGASDMGDGGDTTFQHSVESEIGYGIESTMFDKAGVLIPYTGITATDGRANRLRLGGRFAGEDGFSLNLEGIRENTADSERHQVLLRGTLAF